MRKKHLAIESSTLYNTGVNELKYDDLMEILFLLQPILMYPKWKEAFLISSIKKR